MTSNSSFIENPEYLKYKRIFDDCIEFISATAIVYSEGEDPRLVFAGGGRTRPGVKDAIYFFLKTPEHERLCKYRTNSPHMYISQIFNDKLSVKNIVAAVEVDPRQQMSIRVSAEGSVFNRFYVNEDKKVAYLDIPKCASSSFRESLEFSDKILSQSELEQYDSISIIRNPIDRLISGFLEIRKRRKSPDVFRYYSQPVYDEIFDTWQSLENSFSKMIDLIATGEVQDSHVTPQHLMLSNKVEGDRLQINYFYKFENIRSAVDSHCGLGTYFGMKNLNKTEDRDAAKALKSFLESEAGKKVTDKIESHFAEDFRLYESSR